MSHIYDSYKIALLDASFFLSPFSDEVKKGLSNSKIYVAETFKSELEQYKLILSEKKQKVYEENIKFLDRNTDLNTLNFDSFGEQYRHLHNDIFGFVLLLVNVRARFVVITANQILIQKIVLQGLEVDIYDLSTNSFIKYEFFSTYQSRYKFSEIIWTISATEEKIGSGTKLYRKNGRKIVLGEEINTGKQICIL